jgi:quercetin dioxygenase-like cupin family protein
LDECIFIAETAGMSLHIKHNDLPGPPEAHRFIGAQHGGVPISLFLVDGEPGAGPLPHRHPYAEVFVVHAGEARFEIDDLRLTATAGDILIAPAMSVHRFTNSGEEQLQVTAIHTAPEMDTEWLQPAPDSRGAA